MKARWRYVFRVNDFFFEHNIKYNAELCNEKQDVRINALIELEIDSKQLIEDAQTGCIYITLPYDEKKMELYVKEILFQFLERIRFDHGKILINYIIVSYELIPENNDEAILIGDRPYNFTLNFIEAGNEQPFDSNKLINNNYNFDLMIQYNDTKDKESLIDQFNGFFKILENCYSKNIRREEIKKVLDNDELFHLYEQIYCKRTREDFTTFINEISDIRHKCSHLKNNHEFGYLPTDSELEKIVRPKVDELRVLAKYLIETKASI